MRKCFFGKDDISSVSQAAVQIPCASLAEIVRYTPGRLFLGISMAIQWPDFFLFG
jgi:hypothetical protein